MPRCDPQKKKIAYRWVLGPVANTDTKLLIYGLFQKGRVLAQDGVADGAVSSHPVSAKGILAILGVRIELLAVRVVGAM